MIYDITIIVSEDHTKVLGVVTDNTQSFIATQLNPKCINGLFEVKSTSYSLRYPVKVLQPKKRTTTYGLDQFHIDGLVQESCNSSVLTMDLRISCTGPSIYWCQVVE